MAYRKRCYVPVTIGPDPKLVTGWPYLLYRQSVSDPIQFLDLQRVAPDLDFWYRVKTSMQVSFATVKANIIFLRVRAECFSILYYVLNK